MAPEIKSSIASSTDERESAHILREDKLAQETTKKIMVVYGTRPEAIKVAPVIKELKNSSRLSVVTVTTGQHRSMLDQVNRAFQIVPDYDLDAFEQGQSLNRLTSKLFDLLDPIFDAEHPDAVLIQGDTTSVMATGVAAFYREIPVVHLEAGLRSHDPMSPFPEEANRKIVTQISSLHLAPTPTSRDNLLREGVNPEHVLTIGNTVIDALLHTVHTDIPISDEAVRDAVNGGERILLVTTHRRENWGGAMENVGQALRRISLSFPNDLILLPAHKNPVVRSAILPALHGLENVITCEPLPYQEFAAVMNASHLVLTDSGGIQEEAPTLGKPVLVMRENTERPEAIQAGSVKLVGTAQDDIVDHVSRLKQSQTEYEAMSKSINPYGDGHAVERCIAALEYLLGIGSRIDEFRPKVASE